MQRYGGNGGLDPNYQDELVSLSSPAHSGRLLFFNAALPVGEVAELYAFGGLSQREGRSSGAYRFRYNYWQGIRTGDDTWDFVLPNFITFHERNTHPVYPNGFLPYEESQVDDQSIAAGWRAPVAGWDVDLSVASGKSTFDFSVSGSINASIGAQYLADNPGASSAQIIANAGPTSGHSGSIEFDQVTLNLEARRAFDGRFLSAMAAGFERRTETYAQRAGDTAAWACGLPHRADFHAFAVGPDGAPIDGTVAACGFQGYPGYSPRNAALSAGDRDSVAAYVDFESKPSDALSLGAALRAEDYSDAGGQTTGKFTARLQVTDAIALRGAVSSGFRAPSLSQRRFNSILFVASDAGLTTTFAANEGHPVSRAFGVDSLAHETARNVSAGIVAAYDEANLRFAVDLYRSDIQDRVVRSQGIGCVGVPACDAEQVTTAAFFFNGVDTSTRGLDISARWGTAFAGGYLWLSANGHVNKTEITGENLPAPRTARLGIRRLLRRLGGRCAGTRPTAPPGKHCCGLAAQRGRRTAAHQSLRRHPPASPGHRRSGGASRQHRRCGRPDRTRRVTRRGGRQQPFRRVANCASENPPVERALGHPLPDRHAVRSSRTLRVCAVEPGFRPVGAVPLGPRAAGPHPRRRPR